MDTTLARRLPLRIISRHAKLGNQTRSALVPKIGGLERIFYVFAVMYAKPELVTGWLVMKTFSGWVGEDPESRYARYNGFVIGNILSLLFGLGLGIIASVRP